MRNNIEFIFCMSKLNYEHQFRSGAERWRERDCSRKANGKMAFWKFKSCSQFEYRYCILSRAIESTASNKLKAHRIILTASIICSFVRSCYWLFVWSSNFSECSLSILFIRCWYFYFKYFELPFCRLPRSMHQIIQRVYTRFSYSWYEFNERSM